MGEEETDLTPKIRQDMWIFWGGHLNGTPPCLKCWEPAATIHEEPPRSVNSDWETEGPEHFLPLCARCHDWRHASGEAGAAVLIEMAIKRLQLIGEWKPDRIVRDVDGD